MPQIEFVDVKATYTNSRTKEVTEALKGCSCIFLSNKINVILGESGCGKTTLLRCLTDSVDYEGNIYFDEKDIDELTTQERDLSYVSQDIVLWPRKNIFDNICFPLLMKKLSIDEMRKEVYEVSSKLGIAHLLTRKPKHISIGQQQRVAIARAIVKKPNVYMFDEPFSNLDTQTSNDLRLLIKSIIKELGKTCIFVTHDIQEAMQIADNIIVMDKGQVVASGTPKAIYNSPNLIVRSLIHAGEKNEIQK